MSINIGINGFGRIGRMVLRAGINNPNIRFVAINDLVPAENLAYLMKYDSTHGRFPGNVETDGKNILIDGKSIECVSERDPEQLGWGDKGVDYVIESTGLFTTLEKAELLAIRLERLHALAEFETAPFAQWQKAPFAVFVVISRRACAERKID